MREAKIYLILCFLFSLKLFGQAPVIDSISPKNAYQGDEVTIYGKHFYPLTSVSFGQTWGSYTDALVTKESDTLVKAIVTGFNANSIILTTSNGTDTTGFIFDEPPALTFWDFSPRNGLTGDTITILGEYFKHVVITDVKFGNVSAASFKVHSDREITAVIGNGETGILRVFSGSTSLMSNDSFYFASAPPPFISYFTPGLGEAGALITIGGDNFTEPAAVTIGGVNADSVNVISAQLITARIPVNAGSGIVTVTTSGGVSTNYGFRFISPVILCPPVSSAILIAEKTGSAYQWQVDTCNCYWQNISDNADYTGATSKNLQIKNIQSSKYGYRYSCFITGNGFSAIIPIKFGNNWTGAANNLWNNPANWSCNTLPDANTDVVINSGNVIVSSNVTCRTLTVKPSASITVTPGFTVTITH